MENDTTYECVSTLKHNGRICSILQLRGKQILVISTLKNILLKVIVLVIPLT